MRASDNEQDINKLRPNNPGYTWVPPSVTQASVLYYFVFMNRQFAGNFPDSILDFDFSVLNGFFQKIFVAEA